MAVRDYYGLISKCSAASNVKVMICYDVRLDMPSLRVTMHDHVGTKHTRLSPGSVDVVRLAIQ